VLIFKFSLKQELGGVEFDRKEADARPAEAG